MSFKEHAAEMADCAQSAIDLATACEQKEDAAGMDSATQTAAIYQLAAIVALGFDRIIELLEDR